MEQGSVLILIHLEKERHAAERHEEKENMWGKEASMNFKGLGRKATERNITEDMASLEKYCVVPFPGPFPWCFYSDTKERLTQFLHLHAVYF